MNWIVTVGITTIFAMVLFLSSSIPFRINDVQGQVRCPDGSHRSPSGNCERVSTLPTDLPRCPDGYHRSPSGFFEAVSNFATNLQGCPVGFQVSAAGVCIPVTGSPDQTINQPVAVSIADEISKLAKLKEQGVITEEEFSQMKNNLMKRM